MSPGVIQEWWGRKINVMDLIYEILHVIIGTGED